MSILIGRRQGVVAIAAGLVGFAAHAQEGWPGRPIRMVAPTGAGSGTDIVARLIADKLATNLRQGVLVDNKPGANGVLGIEFLLHQPADGYTITMVTSSSTVVNQAVQPKLSFDVTTDLLPIAKVAEAGSHLVVTPDFPAKTLKEFIDLVRANPDKYNYGSWGLGSSGHLLMSWFMNNADLKLHHVPYKTVPQIYQDLQSGNLQIAWVDAASSVPLIKSGRLRGLTTSASRRSAALPELPTFTEQGFPFNADAWFGIFAAKGTPRPVIDTLNREIGSIIRSADYRERLNSMSLLDVDHISPEQFSATIRADLKVWQEIVRKNNVTVG